MSEAAQQQEQMSTARLSMIAAGHGSGTSSEQRSGNNLQTGQIGLGQQMGASGFGMLQTDTSGMKIWLKGISEALLSRLFKNGGALEQNPFDDVFNGTIVGKESSKLNAINQSLTEIKGLGNMQLENVGPFEQYNVGQLSGIQSSLSPNHKNERG